MYITTAGNQLFRLKISVIQCLKSLEDGLKLWSSCDRWIPMIHNVSPSINDWLCTVLHCGARLPGEFSLNGQCSQWRHVFNRRCAIECNNSHCRSVTVFCMLFKIRFNPVHPLNDTLSLLNAPALVTLGSLVTHRYTYAPPRCRTSQYKRTLLPPRYLFWTILVTLCLMVCDWRELIAVTMVLYWPKLFDPFWSFTVISSFSFSFIAWVCLWG